MIALQGLYVLEGKVIVVQDIVFKTPSEILIFFKENDKPTAELMCLHEDVFINSISPYIPESPV